MKVYEYEGKNLNELKEKVFTELNANEQELYIRTSEEAGGFLKHKKYRICMDQCMVKIPEGLNVNIEAKKRERYIELNLFSDKSSILIGKNGKNLEALQLLIKNSILNTTGFKVNVILDVEDYKEKVSKHLEYNVKKIAREVKKTGVSAKLDPMNSYERRIVHNAVNEISGVVTKSEGEEPNRYIVISVRKED